MAYELDVHNKTVAQAKIAIENYATKLAMQGVDKFEVIHGYNSGNKIKTLVSSASNLDCPLIDYTVPSLANSGKTIVYLYVGKWR